MSVSPVLLLTAAEFMLRPTTADLLLAAVRLALLAEGSGHLEIAQAGRQLWGAALELCRDRGVEVRETRIPPCLPLDVLRETARWLLDALDERERRERLGSQLVTWELSLLATRLDHLLAPAPLLLPPPACRRHPRGRRAAPHRPRARAGRGGCLMPHRRRHHLRLVTDQEPPPTPAAPALPVALPTLAPSVPPPALLQEAA